MSISRPYGHMRALRSSKSVPGAHLIGGESRSATVRPLAFHATWNPTFNISPMSSITFHVARFLRDSLYASNIRYNGLHLFRGSYLHADRPDPA